MYNIALFLCAAVPYIYKVPGAACVTGSRVSYHHAFQFPTSSFVNDQCFVDHTAVHVLV